MSIRDGVWSGETAFLDRAGQEIPVSQVILAHRTEHGEVAFLSTIARDISHQKAQIATLEHRATHDPLTDLPNRILFFDRLNYTLLAAQREKDPLALLVLDLDRFKEINDTLGHSIGDILLRRVGGRIKDTLRDSDTVARLGGDEFAVLLPNVGGEGAVSAARKILAALESPFAVDGRSLRVHLSIGVAIFPDHGTEAAALMHRADGAMYKAKQSRTGYHV